MRDMLEHSILYVSQNAQMKTCGTYTRKTPVIYINNIKIQNWDRNFKAFIMVISIIIAVGWITGNFRVLYYSWE